MYERSVKFSDLSAWLRVEFEKNWVVLLCIIAVQTAVNLLLDEAGSISFATAGFVAMGAQMAYYTYSLKRWDLEPAEGNRFLSFWGMSIMSGLGVLVGTVLLILPGLYLNARWILAGSLVIGDGEAAGDSLTDSWERTREMVWPIVGMTALFYIGAFIPTALAAYQYGEEVMPLTVRTITYLLSFGGIGLGWMLGLALYRESLDKSGDLVEVFA